MNLFYTPLPAVAYEDVLVFCATFTEGVRVEYKREPVQIPKVVSSFANTVGGVWIIGVDAEKKTNRAILPPDGIDSVGLEERIVQAAQTGIYPPIAPAVRVFPVPDKPGRVIAVVKVRPHALIAL
jgi:predicted HTH transcriptional regulator